MNFDYIDTNNLYIINKVHDYRTIENCLRICRDCAEIINTTKNPKVFFERYNLLISITNELITVEKKYKFNSEKPSQFKYKLKEKEIYTINDFINRYYNSIINKINTLKTEKGKNNTVKKFIDDIEIYYNYLNNENLTLINNLYNSLIDNYNLNLRKKRYLYCIYCGKQIQNDSKFCIYCGKTV